MLETVTYINGHATLLIYTEKVIFSIYLGWLSPNNKLKGKID